MTNGNWKKRERAKLPKSSLKKKTRKKWNLSELRRGRNELVISASQEAVQPGSGCSSSSQSPRTNFKKSIATNGVFFSENQLEKEESPCCEMIIQRLVGRLADSQEKKRRRDRRAMALCRGGGKRWETAGSRRAVPWSVAPQPPQT